jgi:hypothetical protein
MISLIPVHSRQGMTKQNLTALEECIIKELDFEMYLPGPLPFLDRFARLMGVDRDVKLCDMARHFLKLMQRREECLNFKPSVCAAASLTMAMNL